MHIDADFPGGNILVEAIHNDLAILTQDLRDTQGWWFYWAFRVHEPTPRQAVFRFPGRRSIGPNGPAYSIDEGTTWQYLGPESVRQTDAFTEFRFPFSKNRARARFCFTLPYVKKTLDRFRRNTAGIDVTALCASRKARPVPLLTTGNRNPENATYRLLLTARHHACEAVANYVMEGILEAISDDDDTATWYREHVAVAAVPFVDCDGVCDGDQGKNRKPRDHNRDYEGKSIYPETARIRTQLPKWMGQAPTVVLDLHCPYIDGRGNSHIHLVGSCDPHIEAAQKQFSEQLEKANDGPLPFHASEFLPFGTSWNTEANFSQGKSCARWAAEQPQVILASGLEIPYADVHGCTVTVQAARSFGRAIARAVKQFLTERQKQNRSKNA